MTTLLTLLMAGGVLAALALVFLFPLLLVVAIVATVFKLAFLAVFLPFRMIGWGVGAVAGLVGLLVRGLVTTGVISILILLCLVPLLPLALIGAGIWWLVRRSARPKPAPAGL
jgi:hypothetical protein